MEADELSPRTHTHTHIAAHAVAAEDRMLCGVEHNLRIVTFSSVLQITIEIVVRVAWARESDRAHRSPSGRSASAARKHIPDGRTDVCIVMMMWRTCHTQLPVARIGLWQPGRRSIRSTVYYYYYSLVKFRFYLCSFVLRNAFPMSRASKILALRRGVPDVPRLLGNIFFSLFNLFTCWSPGRFRHVLRQKEKVDVRWVEKKTRTIDAREMKWAKNGPPGHALARFNRDK